MKPNEVRACFEATQDYQPNWPTPDMTLIDEARRPPPAFPDRALGNLAEPIRKMAQAKSAPADYVLAALLAAAAAAIGNKRFAAPWDGWSEPPVLFMGLVGDPSTGKSPALDIVLSALREIEAKNVEELARELRRHAAVEETARLKAAKWETEVKTAVNHGRVAPDKPADAEAPDPPARYRTLLNDVTIEELVNVASRQFSGLMFVRDELAGWLGNMEKHGRGDRAFWLEAHGGRSYVIDRVKHDVPKKVDYLAIGIVGGIQPDRLARLVLNVDDDGLLARFLLVWPKAMPPERPSESAHQTQSQIDSALHRLHALQVHQVDGKPRPNDVVFTDEAAAMLQEFRIAFHNKMAGADGLLKSHLGKFPGFFIRLALTLAYLEAALADDFIEPREVGTRHAGFAGHLLEFYFLPMAERIYGDAALPRSLRAAARLAKHIRQEGLTEVAPRNVVSCKLSGLKKAEDVRCALKLLADHGWVMPAETRAPPSGPRREIWTVNPAVHDGGQQ